MTYENPADPARPRDSIEQLEGADIKNPITEHAELTEPGEGFEPAADRTPLRSSARVTGRQDRRWGARIGR